MVKVGKNEALQEKNIMIKNIFYLPRQVTKIVLKTLENQGFFKIGPEFTTLLRQMKSSYDKYVVKEVKFDERKNYEERN